MLPLTDPPCAVITIMASYRYTNAAKEARSLEMELLKKSVDAHNLLEAAVPRVVARALLAGTPAYQLTHSVEFASVAFIDLPEASQLEESDDPVVSYAQVHL